MGKAGLENLCNDVFPEAFVLDVHHGIVALRIEGLARFAEGLDAQRVEDLDKLCQGHLHALFIGLVCGLVMQGPLEVIIDGKELLHRIGNGILIDAVLFALRALAEVVIFCSQPQKLIVLLRLCGLGLLQRIGLFGLGLLLGAFRLLRRFRLLGGLRSGRLLLVLFGFFVFLCQNLFLLLCLVHLRLWGRGQLRLAEHPAKPFGKVA